MTREEIDKYVSTKNNWNSATKYTAKAKLYTLVDIGFVPNRCFNYLDTRGYSRYSIKTYFIIAGQLDSRFNQFLKDNAALFKNAYQEKTSVISKDTVIRILVEAAEKSPFLHNLIYLMAFGGLRLSEAQSAKYGSIKENGLEIIGKGRKFRTVPVNTKKFLGSLNPSPETCIAGIVNPRPLLSRYNITPHDLRAFYITHVLRNKILDLDEVQKIVGHSSLSTTQKYIRFDLKAASQKLKEAGL